MKWLLESLVDGDIRYLDTDIPGNPTLYDSWNEHVIFLNKFTRDMKNYGRVERKFNFTAWKN
jgi:hypothetical protein